MTEGVTIALGVALITAVIGPITVAIVNHLISTRNENRKKGLEVAEAQNRRIKALEHQVRRLSRTQDGQPVYRTRVRRRVP